MAKVTIKYPGNTMDSMYITVRDRDLNVQGHVGIEVLVQYMEEMRTHFFVSNNLDIKSIDGCSASLVNIVIDCKSKAHFTDVLKLELTAEVIEPDICDLYFRITRKENGKEVALARAGLSFFTDIPDKFVNVINKYS